MTPEGKVKAQVRKMLDEVSAYYIMPVTYGYGKSGAPDYLCCINGYFFGVECKAGKGEPTTLQLKSLHKLSSQKGIAVLVNEHGLPSLQKVIEMAVLDKLPTNGHFYDLLKKPE